MKLQNSNCTNAQNFATFPDSTHHSRIRSCLESMYPQRYMSKSSIEIFCEIFKEYEKTPFS